MYFFNIGFIGDTPASRVSTELALRIINVFNHVLEGGYIGYHAYDGLAIVATELESVLVEYSKSVVVEGLIHSLIINSKVRKHKLSKNRLVNASYLVQKFHPYYKKLSKATVSNFVEIVNVSLVSQAMILLSSKNKGRTSFAKNLCVGIGVPYLDLAEKDAEEKISFLEKGFSVNPNWREENKKKIIASRAKKGKERLLETSLISRFKRLEGIRNIKELEEKTWKSTFMRKMIEST